MGRALLLGTSVAFLNPVLNPSSYTATFEPITYYTLDTSVESTDSEDNPACLGYVTVDPGNIKYAEDTNVRIKAEAICGERFCHWSGTGVGLPIHPLEGQCNTCFGWYLRRQH